MVDGSGGPEEVTAHVITLVARQAQQIHHPGVELHRVGNRLEDSTVDAHKLPLGGQSNTSTETISSLHDKVGSRNMNDLQMATQFLL